MHNNMISDNNNNNNNKNSKLIRYTLSYSSSSKDKESSPALVNGGDNERQVKLQKVKKVGGVSIFPSKKSSPPATQVRHDAVIIIYI